MDQMPVQNAPVAPVESGSEKNKKLFLYSFFGFIAVVVVLVLGFSIFRVYRQAPLDTYSVGLAKVLQLPAAKVNGERVLYTDYAEDMQAIRSMREYDKAHGGQSGSLSDVDLSDQVLFRMVNNILINNLAKKYGVSVSQTDVDYVKTQVLEKQFGSIDKAAQAIHDRYGWSLAQFEQRVIRPFVLQQKLGDIINGDEKERDAIKTKAQSVLDAIKAGADFASSAVQYGQDGTAKNGGELGWFGRGEMVANFETAAFALKKGQLSPVLVESQFGYHILQVEDRKTDKVKDPKTNKLVDKELVKARHILFMFPTLETELSNMLDKVSIQLYLNLHNPFDKTATK